MDLTTRSTIFAHNDCAMFDPECIDEGIDMLITHVEASTSGSPRAATPNGPRLVN
jgi:hypothetical protein